MHSWNDSKPSLFEVPQRLHSGCVCRTAALSHCVAQRGGHDGSSRCSVRIAFVLDWRTEP